jgi:hypothetical protein
MREFGFRDQSSTWLAIEWGDAEACSAEVTPRDGMIVFSSPRDMRYGDGHGLSYYHSL